ncbi:DUF4112 domain-containing protein [Sphingomonas sp. Y38-1Y]|uniref:DUF4112 domain-containing protein n=1 Tax=Sphingomonas sp. Y38-1Y TaxID=3078265 RepID=UPI0028E1F50F|nr:DUF4112 domain-containing protein [Sphingomonas sp. Y38-1Y]
MAQTRIDPSIFDRLPLKRDPNSVRTRVEAIERVMERSITIPGLSRPIGLDVMLGLIPVAGSFIGAAAGAYMLWEARNLRMSKFAMTRMAGNVGIDWALGLIPGVGIVPDYFFRANSRNLRIIHRHLNKHHPGTVTLDA